MRKRNYRVEVYFTKDEINSLTKKFCKTQLSREAYIRHVLNDSEIKEAPPASFFDLIKEVRNVGSILDRLLRLANINGIIDVSELRKAFDQNRATEKMLWDTFYTPEG